MLICLLNKTKTRAIRSKADNKERAITIFFTTKYYVNIFIKSILKPGKIVGKNIFSVSIH